MKQVLVLLSGTLLQMEQISVIPFSQRVAIWDLVSIGTSVQLRMLPIQVR